MHLGHTLHEDIYNFSTAKCVNDFNRQCNIFFADFRYASSYIRNELFKKMCMSFYGSQVLPLFGNFMQPVYTAFRKAVRRVWKLPRTTHCNLIPHLVGCIDIELWFCKRCINFINMACKSRNHVVRTIANMGLLGSYSVIGQNMRFLKSKFDMIVDNVYKTWNGQWSIDSNVCQCAQQIIELCNIRDSHHQSHLLEECNVIIDYLCTS